MKEKKHEGFYQRSRRLSRIIHAKKDPEYTDLADYISERAWYSFKPSADGLERGQLRTSIRKLAAERGIEKSKVSRIMSFFCEIGFVNCQDEMSGDRKTGVLITLPFYEFGERAGETSSETSTPEEKGKKRDIKRDMPETSGETSGETSKSRGQAAESETSGETSSETCNKEKKGSNKGRIKTYAPEIDIEPTDEEKSDFDDWWKDYPRHNEKQKTERLFYAKIRQHSPRAIFIGTQRYMQKYQDENPNGGNPKYFKKSHNFLQDETYLDEEIRNYKRKQPEL